MKYMAAGTPDRHLRREEYGTGSSRDWAAKGTQLLGIKGRWWRAASSASTAAT